LRLLRWLTLAGLALIGWGCAQQARPQGGPRDEDPPKITRTNPAIGSLNFSGDEVTVYFTEPIRKPVYDKEIFISPFITPPQIKLADSYRKFTINFKEPLRPETTYIITLSEIKDNSEGNSLEEAYLLAFSTGDKLDSLSLAGEVFLPKLGKRAESLTVLLYDADSVLQNEFYQASGLRKRPTYLTQTDAQGKFEFKYLRAGPYRVVGMAGEAKGSGQVAIGLDTVVLVQEPVDSIAPEPVKMLAFIPDDGQAPQIQRYKFWEDRVADLLFTERPILKDLKVWVTDTLGQDSTPVGAMSIYEGEKGPRLLLGLDLLPPLNLHLQGLRDSLGNEADTVLLLNSLATVSREGPWLQAPALEVEAEAWRIMVPHYPLLPLTGSLTLSDTARYDSLRTYFDLDIGQEGFFLSLKPKTALDPDAAYVLRLEGKAVGLTDSLLADSVFRAKLNWFDLETYGSLSGKVTWEGDYQGGIVLEVLDDQKKVVKTVRDTLFNFSRIKEGTYSFRVLLDQDGNGAFTPGTIFPPSWPERIYEVSETVAIRGNWDFEGHLVKVLLDDESAAGAAASEEAVAEEEGKGKSPGPGSLGGRP
ncbi:MAG: Ig-like domain-containing domain, partial [Bacteroidota bacterium]